MIAITKNDYAVVTSTGGETWFELFEIDGEEK